MNLACLTTKASELLLSGGRLAAALPSVCAFFEGGLRWGELSEWGMPWGGGCRDVLLLFLETAHQNGQGEPYWCLWVHEQEDTHIYPPAWQARGVQLSHIRFATTQTPLDDLKPVFTDPFFKVIILDGCQGIGRDDCAYLARRARVNRQVIILLRNYYLSAKKGNVWAKTRVNCRYDPRQETFQLQAVKGLSPRQLEFKMRREF